MPQQEEEKVDYLENYPAREGIVRALEDWRFSSTANYASGGAQQCDVKITELEWWQWQACGYIDAESGARHTATNLTMLVLMSRLILTRAPTEIWQRRT